MTPYKYIFQFALAVATLAVIVELIYIFHIRKDKTK